MSSSRDRWAAVLAEQAASGMSIGRFCQCHRIARSTFQFWRRRLRHEGQPAAALPCKDAFVEAVVSESHSALLLQDSSLLPIVELRCGRRVAVPRRFDSDDLARLVRLLESLDREDRA